MAKTLANPQSSPVSWLLYHSQIFPDLSRSSQLADWATHRGPETGLRRNGPWARSGGRKGHRKWWYFAKWCEYVRMECEWNMNGIWMEYELKVHECEWKVTDYKWINMDHCSFSPLQRHTPRSANVTETRAICQDLPPSCWTRTDNLNPSQRYWSSRGQQRLIAGFIAILNNM